MNSISLRRPRKKRLASSIIAIHEKPSLYEKRIEIDFELAVMLLSTMSVRDVSRVSPMLLNDSRRAEGFGLRSRFDGFFNWFICCNFVITDTSKCCVRL